MLRYILLILLFAVPLPIGFVSHNKNKAITMGTVLRCYLYGQFLMWAAFQILAVPMIWIKCSFKLLLVVFSLIMAGCVGWGIKNLVKAPKKFSISMPRSPLIWVLFLLSVFLIGYQAYKYITGMHTDQDDARYIAEANDAIYYNKMLLSQPETGEYVGDFSRVPIRDVFSPWPIYLAVLSALSGIIPVSLAHTYYAPVLLLISYLAYVCISIQLFKENSERVIFLFLVTIIHLFFAGPAINEGAPPVHTLTRIWQGKGVVEAIAVPTIICQMLIIQKEDNKANWFILACICCGACLLSGLGITLSLVLIGIYGAYIVCCKRFKSIPWLMLSLAPAIVYQIIFYVMNTESGYL